MYIGETTRIQQAMALAPDYFKCFRWQTVASEATEQVTSFLASYLNKVSRMCTWQRAIFTDSEILSAYFFVNIIVPYCV